MNVGRVARIGNNGHTGIFHRLPCAQLPFAQGRRLFAIRRYLHEIEREIALLPLGPPTADKVGKHHLVIGRPTVVALSLIPDNPFDGIGQYGIDHAVPKGRHTQIVVEFLRLGRSFQHGIGIDGFGRFICGYFPLIPFFLGRSILDNAFLLCP